MSDAPLGSYRLFQNERFSFNPLLTFYSAAQAAATDATTILDVGCGRGHALDSATAGRPLQDLRAPGRTVLGIDVDPVGAENPVIDEFRMIEGDHWPVDTGSVDLAFSDWVLEHIPSPPVFVSELARVLRPGGVFLARTVNRHSPLSVAARFIPNTRHGAVISRLQPAREVRDVFPTVYRMNTIPVLAALFSPRFEWAISMHPSLAYYAGNWPRLASVVAAVEPRLPKRMQMVIILAARKRTD